MMPKSPIPGTGETMSAVRRYRNLSDALLEYEYPSIRELQNLVERGVVFADHGGAIGIIHLFVGSEPTPRFTVDLASNAALARVPFDESRHGACAASKEGATDFRALEDIAITAYRSSLENINGNIFCCRAASQDIRAKPEYLPLKLGLAPFSREV
jgi:two-component system, NtrC family, response regulator HydG